MIINPSECVAVPIADVSTYGKLEYFGFVGGLKFLAEVGTFADLRDGKDCKGDLYLCHGLFDTVYLGQKISEQKAKERVRDLIQSARESELEIMSSQKL